MRERVDAFLAARCHLLDGGGTWRDWFRHVLTELVCSPWTFSAKRPGCNSGWQEYLAADLHHHIDPTIVTEWEEADVNPDGPTLPFAYEDERFVAAYRVVLEHLFV